MSENIFKLIENISSKINESCTQKAWWLLEAVTKKTKLALLVEKNFKLSAKQEKLLNIWIEQYVNKNKPIQYIIGNVPFLDLSILINPPILIPRLETEFWCELLINKLISLDNKKIKILDIGTGSGSIALSLAKKFPEAEIWAIDISEQAIKLAKKNIELNNIKNVNLMRSDLFENLVNFKFDLIVSNPPYIDEKLFEKLDPSVKNWEDSRALISKDNGLYLIKEIIVKSKDFLNINNEFRIKKIPQLVIEIDCFQSEAVKQYLEENNFINITLEKDCFQRDRVVSAGR